MRKGHWTTVCNKFVSEFDQTQDIADNEDDAVITDQDVRTKDMFYSDQKDCPEEQKYLKSTNHFRGKRI